MKEGGDNGGRRRIENQTKQRVVPRLSRRGNNRPDQCTGENGTTLHPWPQGVRWETTSIEDT